MPPVWPKGHGTETTRGSEGMAWYTVVYEAVCRLMARLPGVLELGCDRDPDAGGGFGQLGLDLADGFGSGECQELRDGLKWQEPPQVLRGGPDRLVVAIEDLSRSQPDALAGFDGVMERRLSGRHLGDEETGIETSGQRSGSH